MNDEIDIREADSKLLTREERSRYPDRRDLDALPILLLPRACRSIHGFSRPGWLIKAVHQSTGFVPQTCLAELRLLLSPEKGEK